MQRVMSAAVQRGPRADAMRSGDAATAAATATAATSVSESSFLVMNHRVVKVLNSNISTSVTRRSPAAV